MTDERTSLQQLIEQNSSLFWWVPKGKKQNLTLDSVVEAVLNFGTSTSIKQLFHEFWLSRIASIFYKQISKERNNYLPQTIHYFSMYFKKYVEKCSEACAN
jgi:hypothetical protein